MSQTPQEADAQWSDALLARDTVAVQPFMDDDFTLVVLFPALARVTRAEWLATLPDYVISAWVTKTSEWDASDDLAIHTQLVDQTAIVLGADRSGPFTLTDVWRRSGGFWRIWRRVSTPLSSGEMPRMSAVGTN
jgi:ketosteroid isomerase-like protein